MVRIDFSLPLIYTLIITISYWSWIVFEIWLIVRDRGTIKNVSEDNGTRTNIIFWWSLGIILGIFTIPNLLPKLRIPGNAIMLFVIGIIIIISGIILRFWSVQSLGKLFRSTVIIQENHELITHGPYKHLRNPSYTGVLLTFIGFGIGIGNWLSLVTLFLIGLVSFVRRILYEDQALSRRFGCKYDEYRKKTWSLIPFIW